MRSQDPRTLLRVEREGGCEDLEEMDKRLYRQRDNTLIPVSEIS